MAASVEQQTQAIIDAYDQGRARRAESDDAIVKAARVISTATNKISIKIVEDQQPIVDELVRRAETLSLPAPTQQP
jgi:hypothetical protein